MPLRLIDLDCFAIFLLFTLLDFNRILLSFTCFFDLLTYLFAFLFDLLTNEFATFQLLFFYALGLINSYV